MTESHSSKRGELIPLILNGWMYSILTLKTIPVSCPQPPFPQIDDDYYHPSKLMTHPCPPEKKRKKKESKKCMVTCTMASQSLATSSKETNPIVTRAKIEPTHLSSRLSLSLALSRACVCVCVWISSLRPLVFCLLFADELENPTVAVPVVGLSCLGEQRDIDESAERFFKNKKICPSLCKKPKKQKV